MVKKAALNNKDIILKNKYKKNIDENCENLENSSIPCSSSTSTSIPIIKNTVVNHKEKFFEDKPCLSSSKSYNNSSFLSNSSSRNNRNISKKKEQWQELRHFYPLSEKDVDTLNFRAGREFSTNFTNQLLLKLYIKYPEKRFKNRFTFWDYMVKALKREKHQGPLVNNPTFRFSCNISTNEHNILETERYLSQIKNSFDTRKEMQLKKKIAGCYSSEVAYKILTKVELKTNHDNSFITALVPNCLNLSENQIEILSEQLEAVYGMNSYYVHAVDEEMLPTPEFKAENTNSIKKPIGFSEPSKEQEETEEGSAWHQIRKALIEEFGKDVDKAWFSKAIANEDKETNTLKLTMPTRFMADWVRNNYAHVIRRLAGSCGIKSVEYIYD